MRGAHGAHRVRARGADADFVEVEEAGGHEVLFYSASILPVTMERLRDVIALVAIGPITSSRPWPSAASKLIYTVVDDNEEKPGDLP